MDVDVESFDMCQGDFKSEDTEAEFEINNEDDILNIDLKTFVPDAIRKLSFISLDVACLFYTWSGRVNGFSVRKKHIVAP